MKHDLARKEKSVKRGRKILNHFKQCPSTVNIYSDKKIFTVDPVYNRRKERIRGHF